MATDRTTVTELATGLGMLGYPDVPSALAARPPEMVSVSPELWARLDEAWQGGALAADFRAAFDNGAAFLAARDALRGRRPIVVEWRAGNRAPGDEVVPADLRVDHVYLVSCKYESDILANASPTHLFDRLLTGGHGVRAANWYAEVAPEEYQALYDEVRWSAGELWLPARAVDLTRDQQRRLAAALRRWPTPGAEEAYRRLGEVVASRSAERWRAALAGGGAGSGAGGPAAAAMVPAPPAPPGPGGRQIPTAAQLATQEAMLWRLLRIGSAPYFVLGARKAAGLRLRIATPWDWRQRYALRRFDVAPQPGGQPRVGWVATVRDKRSGADVEVHGHVEVRWGHGRFSAVEAKAYLDTPHAEVPGYVPLA